MNQETKELTFSNVREFREFQRELYNFINLEKILEKLGEEKIIMRLKSTHIVFLITKGTNNIATGSIEEWVIIGKNRGVLGEINVKLIEPEFFVLTNNWKLLNPNQLKKLFEISDEYKSDKKIRDFVEKEYKESVKCLNQEPCERKIDHNVALFLKRWAIPISEVKIKLDKSEETFYNILNKFSLIYENKYPIEGIESIISQIEDWKIDFMYKL